jgi:hypothetical protein
MDSLWNTRGNGIVNTRPTFDRLYGIADTRDGSNNDVTYYSPTNIVFPPSGGLMKGRIINTANHILSNIIVVNESKDSIPPAPGTKILFTNYISIKPGDVKSVTLKTLGVVNEQSLIIPKEFSLSQNYPNPFNPSTRIVFGLPRSSHVMLKIYDVIGREVTTLVNGEKQAGTYSVEWNGKNINGLSVSSGIYLYMLRSGNTVISKKMLLVK